MNLFLSSKKNMNILDFLINTENFFIKKYIGRFNLNEFLNNSINKLGHIDMLFIDLSSLNDEKEKLIEIITVFNKYKNIKLGFYMEDINMEIINELISLDIFNIVTKTEVKELKKELEMVFINGMSESYIKEKFKMNLDIKSKAKYNFKDNEIIITVVGALHRIGTTTIAIQLATYLNYLGANVSYVEANRSNHLDLIANFYKMENKNQLYTYKNFKLQKVGINNNEKFNVIIYDLGVINDKTKEGFNRSDLSILVAGDKATEIEYLNQAKKQLKDQLNNNNYNTIINFSNGENNRNKKNNKNNKNKENIYYLKPMNNLFSIKENEEIYNEIIEKYFREIKKNE